MNPSEAAAFLTRELTPANLFETKMQTVLRSVPVEMREEIAYKTHTMVMYYAEEVADVRKAEETAALRAAPPGYDLSELNGLNVGCGDRTVSPFLLGTDAHRGKWEQGSQQSYEAMSALRCWAHDLPFKSDSIDYIIALHVLEHVPDPVEVVMHWLNIVKPGGGIGIVVPDWRYTWDARNDHDPWSHRWNPTPNLLKRLHAENWSRVAALEHVATYRWRLSFDVVLRKNGEFRPFTLDDQQKVPTGNELAASGRFLHSDD